MKISGKQLAEQIHQDIRKKVVDLQTKNIIPKLVIVKTRNLDAVNAYINNKIKRGEQLGINVELLELDDDTLTNRNRVIEIVTRLNKDPNTHGIIFQKPSHLVIDDSIEKLIDPNKDVDGFLPNSAHQGPVYRGVKKVLKEISYTTYKNNKTYKTYMKSLQYVVIGKGKTGGRVVIDGLKKDDLEPDHLHIIDSKSPQSSRTSLISHADVIISAVGKPNPLDYHLLQKNHILIDVGIHFDDHGKIKGDFNEEDIKDRIACYTTTPGGIGALTVAYLMDNVVTAAYNNTHE